MLEYVIPTVLMAVLMSVVSAGGRGHDEDRVPTTVNRHHYHDSS